METPAMFCYQCQETARGKGCEIIRVCDHEIYNFVKRSYEIVKSKYTRKR